MSLVLPIRHPRSVEAVEALARWRGATNFSGLVLAVKALLAGEMGRVLRQWQEGLGSWRSRFDGKAQESGESDRVMCRLTRRWGELSGERWKLVKGLLALQWEALLDFTEMDDV
ncbi:MAG: hypothetical protein JWS08_19950 [Phormidium sp. PBR-2020]|nr:MAG: hypothetical protein JWS08_19950 [Phormidium sp. PBR-2020]